MSTLAISAIATAIGASAACAFSAYQWYKMYCKYWNYVKRQEDDSNTDLATRFTSPDQFPLLEKFLDENYTYSCYSENVANFVIKIFQRKNIPMRRALCVSFNETALYLQAEFKEVIVTNTDAEMRNAATELLSSRDRFLVQYPAEGVQLNIPVRASSDIARKYSKKIVFWDEDVSCMSLSYGKFDCIILVDSITKLNDPKCFLSQIKNNANKECLLIICDVFKWKENKLGQEQTESVYAISEILGPSWKRLESFEKEIPNSVPESARSAVYSIALYNVWEHIEIDEE